MKRATESPDSRATSRRRAGRIVLAGLLVLAPRLAGSGLLAQVPVGPEPRPSPDAPASANDALAKPPAKEPEESAAPTWSFSLGAYTYVLPDDHTYAQPTLTADHGWLHLEARYNYEDLDTGSIWSGYNFSFNVGDALSLGLTPMIGGVFGETMGVAPGYRFSLEWWLLELSSESEYLIDAGDVHDSFFYTWSEVSISPLEWLRLGVAAQRTKVYETAFDVQRGVLLGLSYKALSVTAYAFNLDATHPMLVFAAVLEI